MSFRNTGRGWGPTHFPWLTIGATVALAAAFGLERPWDRETRAAERPTSGGDSTAIARRALLDRVPAADGPAPEAHAVRPVSTMAATPLDTPLGTPLGTPLPDGR